MNPTSIATHGSLIFGIAAVVLPFVLLLAKCRALPMFVSMGCGLVSLCCVSSVMGTSVLREDAATFYDTAPAFMYCSITLLVLVLAINGWLLWRASRA